jgi:hypothetical protein
MQTQMERATTARTRNTPIATPPAMRPMLWVGLLTGAAEGKEELVGWEDCDTFDRTAEPEVEDAGVPAIVRKLRLPSLSGKTIYPVW